MKERGLRPDQEPVTDEQKKGLVRALGNRVMYGISKASTVTPHALVSAALLAHRRRGITARELTERINLLRRIAEEEGARLSQVLHGRAVGSRPALGPIQEAIRTFGSDGMVRRSRPRADVIYQPRWTSGARSCPSTRTR